MNDFKEYSAAFMDHQDDLAHYGVKGMKWRHHKLGVGGVPGLVGNLLRHRRRNGSDDEEEQQSRGSIADSNRRGSIADSNRRGRYADSERAANRRQEVAANRQSLADFGKKLTGIHNANKAYNSQKKRDEENRKIAAHVNQMKELEEKERRRRQYYNNKIADREDRKRGRR